MLEIAILRNAISHNKFGEKGKELLGDIRNRLKNSTSNFVPLVSWALKNTEDALENGSFEEAWIYLHLVHDVPVFPEDLSEWNEKWYYEHRLTEFIDRIKNVNKIKEMIHILGEI